MSIRDGLRLALSTLVLVAGAAAAGERALNWTAPTRNVDGTPLTGLLGYRVHAGCTQSGQYELTEIDIPDPAVLNYTYTGLPEGGDCYFVLRAYAEADDPDNPGQTITEFSAFSGELVDFIDAPLGPSEPVTNLSITWDERPLSPVTWGTATQVHDWGNGFNPSITHGLTINQGDLVFVGLSLNDSSVDITPGQIWDESNVYRPPNNSATLAGYWKIAGASEPSAYTFNLNTSERHGIVVKVIPGSSITRELAFATAEESASTTDAVASAIDGRSIGANHLSITLVGKDWRKSNEAYTTADNSYTGVVGGTQEQIIAIAHRIHTTAETFSGDVIIDTADGNDGRNTPSYSLHITFSEGAAAGDTAEIPSASLNLSAGAPQAVTTEANTAELSFASLSVTGNAPQAVTSELNESQLPSSVLTVTGGVPQAVVAEANAANLPSAMLSVTGAAPQSVTTENNQADVPAASLTLTGAAPQAVTTEANLSDLPGAPLAITANPIVASTGDENFSQLPGGVLTLSGGAPQAITSEQNEVSLPSGALMLSGGAPSAVTSEQNDVSLPVAALTLTGNAPQVESTDLNIANLPVAALSVIGNAPIAETGENDLVALPGASLVMLTAVPTVDFTPPAVVEPDDTGGGSSETVVSQLRRQLQEDEELVMLIASLTELER